MGKHVRSANNFRHNCWWREENKRKNKMKLVSCRRLKSRLPAENHDQVKRKLPSRPARNKLSITTNNLWVTRNIHSSALFWKHWRSQSSNIIRRLESIQTSRHMLVSFMPVQSLAQRHFLILSRKQVNKNSHECISWQHQKETEKITTTFTALQFLNSWQTETNFSFS